MGHSQHQVVVIQNAQKMTRRQQVSQSTGVKMLGLMVNRVEEMEWCDSDLIQSPPGFAVTSELVSFLQGYLLKADGEMLVVLDSASIIAGMPQT
jgi:positive phototaxis protein PixI